MGEIVLILDNLSIHRTLDVLLWALAHPHVRFLLQPTYAPGLNLIAPWRKVLRSLILKGRCFQSAGSRLLRSGRRAVVIRQLAFVAFAPRILDGEVHALQTAHLALHDVAFRPVGV